MFVEPFFVMILSDFTIRLCNLRNERHISQKLQPLTILIGMISLARFFTAIPDLFYTVDKVTFINYEGQTFYKMDFENSLPYQFVDLILILYSLTLISITGVWLNKHMLLGIWIMKVAYQIAVTFFGVQQFLLQDGIDFLNFVVLYQYLNMQTLLCDVEDSREKLDRFFSYNFLFFDDD
ncbi:UNKNOWN [Stylonychia lemnae]|uniref:Uncharacterized protein n=1 Tax=Stylonychia lemnae TaxID=5949 RepID=A0A078B406_STYLE|nr:UNKNOWN [Stylonychia lemnae]|eukprot:CDW88971.1 UNKNOWN [Stylonychia lemnae]